MQCAVIGGFGGCLIGFLFVYLLDKVTIIGFLVERISDLLLLIELDEQVTFLDVNSARRQFGNHQSSQSGPGETRRGYGQEVHGLDGASQSYRMDEVCCLDGED